MKCGDASSKNGHKYILYMHDGSYILKLLRVIILDNFKALKSDFLLSTSYYEYFDTNASFPAGISFYACVFF